MALPLFPIQFSLFKVVPPRFKSPKGRLIENFHDTYVRLILLVIIIWCPRREQVVMILALSRYAVDDLAGSKFQISIDQLLEAKSGFFSYFQVENVTFI